MRNIFIILTLFILSSCSPKKGYLGPERPPEELSVVYYESCDAGINLVKASCEGVEFAGSGIELLPGKRIVDATIERPMRPFNCIPETRFDQYGYSSCLDRRNNAITNGDKYIPDCYQHEYTTTVYWCDQEFQAFLCSISNELVKQVKYNTCCYQQGMEVFMKFYAKSGMGTSPVTTPCQFMGSEMRRIEFSSMP